MRQEDRQHLTDSSKLQELNTLLHGDPSVLEASCQHLLRFSFDIYNVCSNHWGGGKPFQWNSRFLPSPQEFFSITACIALDTNDLQSIDLERYLTQAFGI